MGFVNLAHLQRTLHPSPFGQIGLSGIEGEKSFCSPMQRGSHMQDVHGPLQIFLGVGLAQLLSQVQNFSQINGSNLPKPSLQIGGQVHLGCFCKAKRQPLPPIPLKKARLQTQPIFKLETHECRKGASRRHIIQKLVSCSRIILLDIDGEEKRGFSKEFHLQSPLRSSMVPCAIKSSMASQSAWDKTGPSLKIAFRRAAKSGRAAGLSGLSGTSFAKGFPRRVTRTSSPAASHAAIFGK